jgi:hypothetical protein
MPSKELVQPNRLAIVPDPRCLHLIGKRVQ